MTGRVQTLLSMTLRALENLARGLQLPRARAEFWSITTFLNYSFNGQQFQIWK